MLSSYKKLEKPILYIIIAEFFVQLVNVTFMNLQPVYMEREHFSEGEISALMAFRFLGVVLLAFPLGFLIAGKKVKKLFYLSALCVPVFGALIIYSIYSKNIVLLYFSQIFWGASFTFIQVPIIPFIMRNSSKENHTSGISLSYATWSFAGIVSGILIDILDIINPEFFDEKVIIIIVCFISLAGLFFLRAARIDEKVIARGTDKTSVKKHNWHIIIKALTPTLIIAVGAGMTIPLISLFFFKIHNLDKGGFAPVSTAAAVLVALAAVLVPAIKKNIGYKIAIPFTQSLAVISLVALATTEFYNQYSIAVTIAVIFYLLRQPLMNVAGPMTTEVVMNYVGPKNREMVSVLTSAIWSGSWFVSLLFSSAVFHSGYSFVNLFLITSLLYALGVAWYYWLIIDFNKRQTEGLIDLDL
ncbi:MAG: MFS transporter [Bacteroidota bacterium]